MLVLLIAAIARRAAQSAPPIVVNVPPPQVHIAYPPENIWAAYIVPIATLLFAAIGTWVTILSYQKIDRQIKLADDDLKINREQAELANAERARKPNLVVSLAGHQHLIGTLTDTGNIGSCMSFDICNVGPDSAPATDITVELLFPRAFVDVGAFENEDDRAIRFGWTDVGDGRQVASVEVDKRTLVAATGALLGTAYFTAPSGNYAIDWMVKCTQGFWPVRDAGKYDEYGHILIALSEAEPPPPILTYPER